MKLSCLKTEYLKIIKPVYLFSKTKAVKLYLVGGILRDIFLDREKLILDFDFCLKKSAINFSRQLARQIKAGFVVLDKEHGACRLVKRVKDKDYTLDFTDFRGKTLEEDLLHRDFTINTLALELQEVFRAKDLDKSVIDLYAAREDLRAGIIRAVNKRAFDEDPLRILRAFSFACMFGFKIDKETLKSIKLKREMLCMVSAERLREELFKILNSGSAFAYLAMLDELKILKIIIPEIELMRQVKQGPYHHLDVWQHSLETVRQLELLIPRQKSPGLSPGMNGDLFKKGGSLGLQAEGAPLSELKNNREIQAYLDEVISSGRRRRALIKLGALLHDIGKPAAMKKEDGKTKFHGHERIGLEITKDIVARLRLSNDEMDSLRKMVFWHLRPGYLADNAEVSRRAAFRYFRDTAQESVSTLLLSIADQRATRGPLTSKNSRIQHEKVALGLIKDYFKKKKEKKLPRLISGDDLIEKFRLAPSPLIGRILSEVEELQAIGKISSKKEALAEAKKLLNK